MLSAPRRARWRATRSICAASEQGLLRHHGARAARWHGFAQQRHQRVQRTRWRGSEEGGQSGDRG
jgi:hypothetical protein